MEDYVLQFFMKNDNLDICEREFIEKNIKIFSKIYQITTLQLLNDFQNKLV